MDFSYCIFILTFLIFPLFALLASRKVELKRFLNILGILSAVFLIHNLLFFKGFSLRGDYVDYIIFSSEYFLLCLLIFSMSSRGKLLPNIFRIFGILGIGCGVVVGIVGILLFLVVAQDYETDKIFNFTYRGSAYEVRRYSFGFATLNDIKYTFETYATYHYLPIEHKIDKTCFFGMETELYINEDALLIYIVKDKDGNNLVFKSSNGKLFSKKLD